jgi:EpsD family peptidyl-prolyl cis-trans isomerase
VKPKQPLLAGAAAACLLFGAGACVAAPKPDVVATLGGDPITREDLAQELVSMGAEPNATTSSTALREIVARRLMAARARKEGMDRTPEFLAQIRRGEEGLLAQNYQRKLATGVANPGPTEVAAYVASHPEMFEQRRILLLSQLVVSLPSAALEKFKPLRTLAEVRRVLDEDKIPYRESIGLIDTLTADPQSVATFSNTQGDDVIITPARGGGFVFNQVAQARPLPFVGPAATIYAAAALKQERGRNAVRESMAAMVKDAEPGLIIESAFGGLVPSRR